MDDQELMDLFWNQKRFVVAHWDGGVSGCATSSLVLYGDRRVSSNLLIAPDVDVRTPEKEQNSQNQIIESNNSRFLRRFGEGSPAQRHLLVVSAVLIVALLAISTVLLSLYLQDTSRLDTVYKERDRLSLNLSHSMADIETLRDTTGVLARNLSSLMGTISSTRDRTVSGLIRNQTDILQEIEIRGRLHQVELQEYLDLQEKMENISRRYLSIPRGIPLLQNCHGGTVCPFCSAGWHFFETSCYLLSPQTRNWQESLHWCRRQGAHLVVIGSQEEQEFLQKVVKTSSWIGLSDRDMEGHWQWVDGTPYNATPNLWLQKQPDNLGNEDCAVLLPGSMWNDEKCRKLYSSVCEYRAGELQLPVDGLHDGSLGP